MATITSSTLFTPEKSRGGSAKAFWTSTKIGLYIAIPYAMLNYFGVGRASFFYFLALSLLYVIPFMWLMWLVAWAFGGRVTWQMKAAEKLLKSKQATWEDSFKKHTGVSDRISVSGYLENGLVQVDGIAYKDHLLHFMCRGRVFSLPFTSVRDWQWKIETADSVSVHGTGLQAATIQASVNESNLHAAGRAFLHSGLFLKIADENNPVLHFHCNDEATLQRWQEILTQIQEGKI